MTVSAVGTPLNRAGFGFGGGGLPLAAMASAIEGPEATVGLEAEAVAEYGGGDMGGGDMGKSENGLFNTSRITNLVPGGGDM